MANEKQYTNYKKALLTMGKGLYFFKYPKGQASTMFKDIYHNSYHGKV